MQRLFLPLIIFLVGLAAPLWIGAGYVGHHAAGAAVALLIAVCYAAGGVELFGYRRSTQALAQSLEPAETEPSTWLARIPSELRGALRLRIEGERVALPGPALTPYLVGLLVLLGMLGTLLGMMATLRGTGMALESATDLQSIRGSLASPVEGLAVAFGTSIAGVAASAMLGLLSSLLRRERGTVMQAVDAHIVTALHSHSRAWQRSESLRLLQLQAQALPPVVERLQALIDGMQHTQSQHGEQMLARQGDFTTRSEAAQQQLAATLEAIVQRSAQDSANAVSATLQPLVQQTLHGLAEVAASQNARIERAVDRQLQALQQGFADTRQSTSQALDSALASQLQHQQALLESLRAAVHDSADQQRQASQQLLQDMTTHLAEQAATHSNQWAQALEQQRALGGEMAQRHDQTLQQSLTSQQQATEHLLAEIATTSAALHAQAASQDQQRLQHWQQAFTTLAEAASTRWEQAGALQNEQAQQICKALAEAGQRTAEHAQQQASATLGEISRLLDAAAEAPRAAAEVIAELRQQLSASIARDNVQLEERAQLLGTLQSLMEAVNHASTEQRGAMDALIESAAGALQRSGERFAEQVAQGSGRLDLLASQLAEGAQGVGTLAAGLETAVQAFGEGSSALSTHLQTLATALDASLVRSDEQLAYYVAQAREVVDLTLMSQKQVLDELQQLAQAPGDTAA